MMLVKEQVVELIPLEPCPACYLNALPESGRRLDRYLRVRSVETDPGSILGQECARRHVVVLTGSRELAMRMSREGICCLGIEDAWEGISCIGLDGDQEGEEKERQSAWFPGAALVLVSAEGISADLILRTFDHWHGLAHMICETDRLYIRESCPEEFGEIKRLGEEAAALPEYQEIASRQGWMTMTDRDAFEAYTSAAYRFYDFGMYSVWEKASEELIGWCGLAPAETEDGGVQLGYLIRADRRGRGLGEEACRGILEYAVTELAIPEVLIRTGMDNPGGAALGQKLKRRYPFVKLILT